MQRFILTGLLLAALAAASLAVWIHALAANQALNDARDTTQRLADYAVGLLAAEDLLDGGATSTPQLDRLLDPWLKEGSVLRVKVWDTEGRIVYSDVPSLIGQRFSLPDRVRDLTEGVGIATLENQNDRENKYESGSGDMVEVYVRTATAAGQPLIFEAYFDDKAIRQQEAGMVPVFLLSLVALLLAQSVSVVRLARRIHRDYATARRRLQASLDASRLEHARITRDLHDDIIQNLAGLSYAMEAEEIHGSPDQRRLFAVTRVILQDNVRTLRAMARALQAAEPDSLGLPEALQRLADALTEQGIAVQVRLQGNISFTPEQAGALYCVARECLRNIANHSGSHAAELHLRWSGDRAWLLIGDDGRGFDTHVEHPDGRLGLRIMKDAVQKVNGSLTVRSRIGGGTSIMAAVGGPRPVRGDRRRSVAAPTMRPPVVRVVDKPAGLQRGRAQEPS
jgi:signal transduction histidine kinase